MALAFQSHKALHSWPTTNVQAQKYQTQKPQIPYYLHYNSAHEPSLHNSHSRLASVSSCYSVPETLPKSNLKIETASQLRSFSSASDRILRPPLQLHQRPFLSSENIRPARPTPVRRSQSDPDRDYSFEPPPVPPKDDYLTLPPCSLKPPPVPPKDDCLTLPPCSLEPPPVPPKDDVKTTPQQGHNLCISGESDTGLGKRYTFGYMEPPSTYTSYWSDPSCSESGSSTEDEEDSTDAGETDFETSDIEDSLLHFSTIQAQRVSYHTWILNPTTDDIAPNARSKLNWRGQIGNRNIAGPYHSKEVKRWGIIF